MLIVMRISIELEKVISTRVFWLFHSITLQNVQGDPVQSTSTFIWHRLTRQVLKPQPTSTPAGYLTCVNGYRNFVGTLVSTLRL